MCLGVVEWARVCRPHCGCSELWSSGRAGWKCGVSGSLVLVLTVCMVHGVCAAAVVRGAWCRGAGAGGRHPHTHTVHPPPLCAPSLLARATVHQAASCSSSYLSSSSSSSPSSSTRQLSPLSRPLSRHPPRLRQDSSSPQHPVSPHPPLTLHSPSETPLSPASSSSPPSSLSSLLAQPPPAHPECYHQASFPAVLSTTPRPCPPLARPVAGCDCDCEPKPPSLASHLASLSRALRFLVPPFLPHLPPGVPVHHCPPLLLPTHLIYLARDRRSLSQLPIACLTIPRKRPSPPHTSLIGLPSPLPSPPPHRRQTPAG